ncbi:hypothetical protein T10_7698 [Trichinella papuae]|uniref:Uncharacterized protein n=1 Tax=Trichinella papuae TaxID=268474 RepID=A0A0V1LW68_9BILA|nr:hypothetical protein T10_7698 [Trichinella papuae]
MTMVDPHTKCHSGTFSVTKMTMVDPHTKCRNFFCCFYY